MPYEVILYRKNSGQVMGQFGPYARKADADADARALSTQSNPDWGTMVKKVGAALGKGAKATGRGIAKGVKHGTEYAREGAARASETARDTAAKAKDAVVMAKLSGRVEGLESCYEALGGRGALGGIKLEGLGAYREAQDELHDYQEGSKRGAYKRKTSRETAREKRAGARESRLAANPSWRGATEDLVLFITNDGDLYRSQTTPIITNLARKKAKGTFNKKLAPKIFQYLADAGAKKINRLEGFRGRGYGEFTPDSRRAAAKELLDYYMEQINEEAKELKKGKKKNPRSRKNPKFAVGDKVKYSVDGLRSRPERGHLRGVITAAPPEGGPNPPDCYSVDWTFYNEIIKTVEKPTALAGDLAASSKSRKNSGGVPSQLHKWESIEINTPKKRETTYRHGRYKVIERTTSGIPGLYHYELFSGRSALRPEDAKYFGRWRDQALPFIRADEKILGRLDKRIAKSRKNPPDGAPSTRRFDGRVYRYHSSVTNKKMAEAKAKRARKLDGLNARVVPIGHRHYAIYTSKRSR